MQQKQAQKTKRYALFSENERSYLRGEREFNAVKKAELHQNLEKRFDELIIDLQLLEQSGRLKNWKILRAEKYRAYQNWHVFTTIF